jgi:hypothetical protein
MHSCRGYLGGIFIEDHHPNIPYLLANGVGEDRTYGEEVKQNCNLQRHSAVAGAQHRHHQRIQATPVVHSLDNPFQCSV